MSPLRGDKSAARDLDPPRTAAISLFVLRRLTRCQAGRLLPTASKAANVSYELDPELVTVMAALAEQTSEPPARGDWKALRQAGELGQAYLATLVPPSREVQTATFRASTHDGASIELRWYTKTSRAAADPGPAVVYAHGGGMVLGTLDLYDELISWYV